MPEIWCTTCNAYVNPEQGATSGLYCGECGEELEGFSFEEGIEFNEDHTMAGHFISTERAAASAATALAGVPQFTYDENGKLVFSSAVPQSTTSDLDQPMTESRLQTIEKAKKRIASIALMMKIPNHYIDRATNTYKLALLKGCTKSRNPEIVAAACLYFVLRQDKQPFMLMDFSEAMKTDVFLIGHCFLDLMNALNFKLPTVEPFFYVRRFANRLLLNSIKENQTQHQHQEAINRVIQTTLKLIASMKRNWIQTGRRPAGICAAALLVAARIHGFKNVSKQDVVKVVKICTVTLTKRLMEFDKTETAQLSFDEFEKREQEINNGTFQGTIEVLDPPAYSKSLKEKMKLLERDKSRDKESSLSDAESVMSSQSDTLFTDVNDKDVEEAEQLMQDKDIEQITTELEKGDQFARKEREKAKKLAESTPVINTPPNSSQQQTVLTLTNTSVDKSSDDKNLEEAHNEEFDEFENAFDDHGDRSKKTQLQTNNNRGDDTISQTTQQQTVQPQEEPPEEEIDTLSDFEDDSEIEEVVITEDSEIESREKLWDELHLEYVQMMEENRKEKEEKRKQGGGRRRRTAGAAHAVDASSGSIYNMGGLLYGTQPNVSQVESHAVYRSASEASANLLRAKIARNLVSKSLFDEDELISDTQKNQTVDDIHLDEDTDDYSTSNRSVLGKRATQSIQEKNKIDRRNENEFTDEFEDEFGEEEATTTISTKKYKAR
ncbi:hypothetical protein C9374_010396 [Naegleria lovaniensis]|uniref:B-related factor 1 n=1 Tax=Naegleria lovaniensis TaxID=51637 RepID=A0AA88GCJ7_NAELO|nr:uncharacterized protein C9374_012958 [Naegleria lovaniensis]XP_044543993.1 uncharacterized protein C9374_010396 [Naegleria lovaniensis]KAG2373015.1 hypothetical protein C9374_012958 [Naegleria lovaniensis]KAG2374819.1 hypothetical protein C9374_010396 [Naegleria lovaniensis]